MATNVEVVVVPLSGVDRPKGFYVLLGWREDAKLARTSTAG